ncbi:serine/arginine repetitive matrix protein 2 isoform X2 [Procambarus clarkii]|uniref:serine/arginine repetitive matrix protein 2 isoform X2 n=1 Tax=Procambarus clarkii TaxID=6728 RepID=UPI001E676022|nr:serine/arginine repetitive matrix protein 2-like isoform X2 [Procambarus clarkii]
MSERYSRPRTPPGPPPTQGPRKPSTRGPSTSATSSKSAPPKSYEERPYDKYDKPFTKPSSYPSSKPYADDKYKSASVRKIGDKVPNNKFVGKSDVYGSDIYKPRDIGYSSDRFNEKDNAYVSSYPDKGRYTEKYPTSAPYTDKFPGKKFAADYDAYPEKTSRYPRHESEAYYGAATNSYDAYASYDAYGGDRHVAGGYSGAKHGMPLASYGDKYGGRGGMGGYGGEKLGGLSYGGDKLGRGGGGYGVEKHGGGGSAYPRDKLSTVGYDGKPGTRTRVYPDDDRRPYRDYTPPRTGRSPLQVGGGYGDYDQYSPPARSPGRQYLDRYVIGDSVVYGPPGQYPRDLRPSSPHARPPSPPSPQPLVTRSYPRYTTGSPRRYNTSSTRRSPPLQPTVSTQYRSPSPLRRVTSPRRPPSPPTRRPPSPYLRGQKSSRERSFEHTRSKERYNSKAGTSGTARSPSRDSRSVADRRGSDRSRSERDKRKEPDRRLSSRERTHDTESVKRLRPGERDSDYRNSDVRSWGKNAEHSSSNQTLQKDRSRDERNQRSPVGRSVRGDASRDRRREGSRERDRNRRIEDRLGPTPIIQTTRRSPVARPRVSRRPLSPRDKKRSRSRLLARRTARSSERSTLVKRSRLGDPKKRLGGYKARRRALPVKRNKILKKYQRLTVKRGPRSGGGTGGGRASNRSNKESGANREEGEEGDRGGGDENRKPGSTATIRRIIKKPRNVSSVNRLTLKPRVIRKPAQKLLKDPKEAATTSKERTTSQSSKGESSPRDEKPANSSSEANKRPSRSF